MTFTRTRTSVASVEWHRKRNEEVFAFLGGRQATLRRSWTPEDDALLLRAWQLRDRSAPGTDESAARFDIAT